MPKSLPLAYIELSSKNLIHNVKSLRAQAKKGTKVSVAVKGNAYGHGEREVVKVLEGHVDYFQIDSIEELRILRKVTKKSVLLLGYVQKSDLGDVIKLGAILSVYSLEQLKSISAMAEMLKRKQEVHLSVDAHLGREGFMPETLPEVFEYLKKNKNLKLAGVYAHFANIEDTNNFTHAKRQIKRYEEVLKLVAKHGFKKIFTHMSATSGLLVYEKAQGVNALVRLGIGAYGMWPSKHIEFMYKQKLELLPVLSWKTKVAQVKELPAGHTVGYGLTHMTYEPTRVAVIPQGYADGLDRRMSNNGEVLIRGARCKIIGRVSMNMCTVDVTHLDQVGLEDEVVIIGTQGKEKISAEDIAQNIGTINYEVTTRLSSLLPRIIT